MWDFAHKFGETLWALTLDSAPSLLFGIIVCGLLVTLLPTSRLAKWLSGSGPGPVIKSALLGIPMPLCSCSVVPVAMGLHRSGASRGSTLSFLISTPENGPDAIALSYTLLGPFMAVARIVSAFLSAVVTGLIAGNDSSTKEPQAAEEPKACCKCSCSSKKEPSIPPPLLTRIFSGIRYAATDIFDDLLPWLTAGLLAAAFIETVIPANGLAAWGSGLLAKIVMVLVGIPMYICASASTPVAASLLALGISPGTVLVFLLAGPATNLGTVGLIRKELGSRALSAYLVGAALVPLVCGLVVDQIPLAAQSVSHTGHCCHEPSVTSILCLVVLLGLAIKPLRNLILGEASKQSE